MLRAHSVQTGHASGAQQPCVAGSHLPDGADVSHVFCGKQKDTIVHRTLKV